MDEDSVTWKIFHSLWILIAILPFIGGLAFIWIGLRVNEKKWKIEGIIYMIPFFLMFFLIDYINTLVYLIFFVWLWCIIRAFLLSGQYLRKLKEKTSFNTNNEVSNPINIPNTNNHHVSYYEDRSNKIIFEQNNQENLNDGNIIDFTNVKEEVEIPIIDIEKATREDLTKLPGITITIANEIIGIREKNKIYSINDLQSIQLKHEQADSLKRYVQFSKKDNPSNSRRLDL